MSRMIRLLLLALSPFVFLAACQSAPAPTPDTSGTFPTPIETITWNRSPDQIVFRAEVSGGNPDEFARRNDIPPCTIYGDNRVVWTVTNVGIDDTVLFDVLSDEVISTFARQLIEMYNLYQYTAGAELVGQSEPPVTEQLTLNVNGRDHRADAFGGLAYADYEMLRDACRSLSQTPIAFEPQGAWVSVQRVDYDPNRSSILWDANAWSWDLNTMSSNPNPQWLSDTEVRFVWSRIRSMGGDVRFESGEGTYQIALQIPFLTLNAPPPPAS